ncbi:MAG: hypothetical protein ACRBCT_04740 [Alphaproteobacteria bacterium]
MNDMAGKFTGTADFKVIGEGEEHKSFYRAIMDQAKALKEAGFTRNNGYGIRADFENGALTLCRRHGAQKVVGVYNYDDTSATQLPNVAPEPAF